GQSEDPQVEFDRPIVDIPDVELDAFWPGQLISAIDLRPPCHARQRFEPSPLPRTVLLDLVAESRARTDQAHVALEDVDELGQLVDARGPEYPSNSCDARIAGTDASPLLGGVLRH